MEIPVYKALGDLFVKEGVGRPDFTTIANAVGIRIPSRTFRRLYCGEN